MAAIISDLTQNGVGGANDVTKYYTPEVVDRAVERVLAPYDDVKRDRLLRAWSTDDTGPVAAMLEAAVQASAVRIRSYDNVARVPVQLGFGLRAEEQRSLAQRYPDLNIVYRVSSQRDHGLAGADRKLASIVLHSKIPVHMPYVDFGGDVMMHVENGNRKALVVGGMHRKDQTRNPKIALMLKRISGNPEASPDSRGMADSILRETGTFYRDANVSEFSERYLAGVMSHVYDVRLEDVAMMMERCGMEVLEGVMHFSNRFFFEDEGVLEDVGARFRIKNGRFEMGFEASNVEWYGHDWKEFMLYGADQVLMAKTARYSYKVTNRRGSTIEYRVLRIGDGALPNPHQFMARPGVPMVEVRTKGFETDGDAARRRARVMVRTYPEDVWDRMVRKAMSDAQKGALNFHEHVQTYNGITAGHKYNGVSTVSGTVDALDVPWLVIDSALYGLTQVLQMRQQSRAFVDSMVSLRKFQSSGAFVKMCRVLGETMLAALKAPLDWLMKPFEALMHASESNVGFVVEAAPLVKYVRIDAGQLSPLRKTTDDEGYDQPFPFARYALETAELDEFVHKVRERKAAEALAEPGAGLAGVHVEVDGDVTDLASTTQVESGQPSDLGQAKPDWVPMQPPGSRVVETYSFNTEAHSEKVRRAAVLEAATIASNEYRDLVNQCAVFYSRFCPGGVVDEGLLKAHSGKNHDLDFWSVNKGALGTSLLGTPVSLFDYGGVWCPVKHNVRLKTGDVVSTNVVTVNAITVTDKRGTRSFSVLESSSYSGWVLTVRQMKVLNSLEVEAGLRTAHGLAMDYEASCMLGVPGCGKTTTICEVFRRGDLVLSPLKRSVDDVRKKLVQSGKLDRNSAAKSVLTVDSVLCRVGRGSALPRVQRVLIDECYTTLGGKVYAVAALFGARYALLFGDPKQIEPVVTTFAPVTYMQVSVPHEVKRWVTFRCAPKVVAVWSEHYEHKVRTYVQETGEVEVHSATDYELSDNPERALLMMNQATKTVIRSKYGRNKGTINTTHEKQGGEADEVVLFNTEMRKMGENNPTYLYNNPRYVAVAASRARTKFVYVRSSAHEDLVTRWAARADDPAFVAALSDVSTAGQPVSVGFTRESVVEEILE